MSLLAKSLTLGGLAVLGVAAVTVQFINVRERGFHLTEHTVNAGELTSGDLVGQTFQARNDKLSAVAVMFATYSGRNNTEPVVFHLRESIEDTSDLRTVVVEAAKLGDNQSYRFDFEPVPGSAGKIYFFYLDSPTSAPGNSVTVDLNTQDPYHLGTAYLVRDSWSSGSAEVLARSGKSTVDTVFSLYYTVPLRVAALHSLRLLVFNFIGTWAERVDSYILWLKLASPIAVFAVLLWWLGWRGEEKQELGRRAAIWILIGLMVVAVLFRLFYAVQLPVTNDEGNYLYDAWSLRQGVLAGGDGYVKAPLVIGWIAAWQYVLGNTVMAGRVSSIVVSVAVAGVLYAMAAGLRGRKAGLLSAAAWCLFGAPTVFGIYAHTQSLAIFFGVLGLATIWSGVRRGKWWARFFLGGLFLGLGVASRKSDLALGLVPLVLILFNGSRWRLKLGQLVSVGAGFIIVMTVFLGASIRMYGCENPYFLVKSSDGSCIGIQEPLGLNSAEDGLTSVTKEERDNVRAYSLRGMTPFFRESLPLILLSLIGWGLLLEKAMRKTITHWLESWRLNLFSKIGNFILPRLIWILPAWVLWWGMSFFFEYEGEVFHEFGGIRWIWLFICLLVGLAALWPVKLFRLPVTKNSETEVVKSKQPDESVKKEKLYNVVGAAKLNKERREAMGTDATIVQWAAALVPLAWLGGLAILYFMWIKFHANYLAEFLPPLALVGGLGAYDFCRRLRGGGLWVAVVRYVVLIVFIGAVAWSGWVSNLITYMYEHTGTFDQGAAKEAAEWVQKNIPSDETIFTGAALIPYLSEHQVTLNIAHPRWYAYEFTRQDNARLDTFLPPIDEMLQAYRQANWFLLEKQTGFSFLMEYLEIEAGLEKDWELVYEVENLSNPLKFYRRINAVWNGNN